VFAANYGGLMKGIIGILKKPMAVLAAVLVVGLAQVIWAADASVAGSAAGSGVSAPTGGGTAKANVAGIGNTKEIPAGVASSYTVTFNPKGGTVTPTTGVTGEGGLLATWPTPIRNGYAFSGWFTDTTGGKQVMPSTVFSANTAVYARWALVTYTVTFDAAGGKGAAASGTTGEGGTLASLPAPTKTGYTLIGWYTAPTGGSQVTTNTAFGANATIYARWALITHTVTFDAKGGTVTPSVGTTGVGGTLASLPTPTRAGYNFSGWFTAVTGGDSVTTGRVYDANATIHARWTPVTYTVIFNATGGTVSASQKVGVTGDGWKLSALPVPTRAGYTFDGWFTSAAGGDSVTTARVYSAGTTIYAHWKVVKYTVTFNAAGGKVVPASATTGEGWTLAFLPTPTRPGYAFEGWYTTAAGDTGVTTGTVFSANSTIYAKWSLITHTVTFNTAGGKASSASGVTGEGWKLASLPTPTRTGYTFDGWFTAATGGTPVTTGITYSANTTIHARWKLIRYTVTFDVNITGGKVNPASGITGEGWKLASLPVPTRDGYSFEGWFTASSGGDSVTTNTVFNANTTIYARWKLTTSMIKLNPNGGTVSPASITTGEGWKFAFLPTPARDGYTFAGWFTAAAGGTAVTTGMAFSANATVYARWTLITHKVTFEPNITGGKVITASAATGDNWALASLPTPTRDGYTFDGWFTAPTGGTAVTPNTAFSANAVIYARWTPTAPAVVYTITFNANGSTVTPAFGMTDAVGRLASLPTPTKPGYIFEGWYTALTGGTKVTTKTVFSENTTIYARWVAA